MTLSRKEAAHLLGTSLSTLQRRTKAGRYHGTKIGSGQFAELVYSYSGIGLPEPVAPVEPELVAEQKPVINLALEPEPSSVDTRIETDRQFASAYLSGEASDSNGNRVDGTNRKFPTLGATSLLGPRRLEPKKPQSGTSHMDPRLLSDAPDPTGTRPVFRQTGTGFTRSGEPLAAGLSQEQYNEMMASWRGGRSQAEIEMAERRSKDAMLSAFPKADRK